MEGSCSGAAEGLEISPASPPLLRSSGHPGRLALSPGQKSLPASVRDCVATTGAEQRLPLQAEVSSPVKVLLQSSGFFSKIIHSERSRIRNACETASKCLEIHVKELLKLTKNQIEL